MELLSGTYGEILNFDTFIQGLFFIFTLSLGCLLFFTDNLGSGKSKKIKKTRNPADSVRGKHEVDSTEKEQDKTLKLLTSDLTNILGGAIGMLSGGIIGGELNGKLNANSVSKSIIVGVAIVFMSLTMGVLVKIAGDTWMSKSNIYHLGFKYVWKPKSDRTLILEQFDKIVLSNRQESKIYGEEFENTPESLREQNYKNFVSKFRSPNSSTKTPISDRELTPPNAQNGLNAHDGMNDSLASSTDEERDSLVTTKETAKEYMPDEDIIQAYYFMNHEIRNHQNYTQELRHTAIEKEYAGAFALSLFALFVLSYLNLISMRVRVIINRYSQIVKPKEGNFNPLEVLFFGFKYDCRFKLHGVLFNALFALVLFYNLYFFFFYQKDFGDYLLLGSEDMGKKKLSVILVYLSAFLPMFVWIGSWFKFRFDANMKRTDISGISSARIFRMNYLTIIFLYIGLCGYLLTAKVWQESRLNIIQNSLGYYVNSDDSFKEKNKRIINYYAVPESVQKSEKPDETEDEHPIVEQDDEKIIQE